MLYFFLNIYTKTYFVRLLFSFKSHLFLLYFVLTKRPSNQCMLQSECLNMNDASGYKACILLGIFDIKLVLHSSYLY